MWLKPNISCFYLQHGYKHGVVCLKFSHILAQKAYDLWTRTESKLKNQNFICSYKKENFVIYSFSEQVAAKENFLEDIPYL